MQRVQRAASVSERMPANCRHRARSPARQRERPWPAPSPSRRAALLRHGPSGPGSVAAEEIERDLGGEVKRTGRGLVVFRVAGDRRRRCCSLRTTEDVFLLAWGTDQLTYRAEDLDKIRRWTAHDADWDQLLRLHHAVRPKPKGKPTYRLVTQMEGEHGYLRRDARKALARGLAGKLPASWRPAEENAAVEVWLTIDGATAVCGLRLSDRTMRHRTYKLEHRAGLAAADGGGGDGAPGRDQAAARRPRSDVRRRHASWPSSWRSMRSGPRRRSRRRWAATSTPARSAPPAANLRRLGPAQLARWDATRLPLADAVGGPHRVQPAVRQAARRAGGDRPALPRRWSANTTACCGRAAGPCCWSATPARCGRRREAVGWKSLRRVAVRVLGQKATVSVWRKGGE